MDYRYISKNMGSSGFRSNKWLICRICLKETIGSTLRIFDDPEMVVMIEECGGVELSTASNYPDRICQKCLTLLRAAAKFREKVQNSQAELSEKFKPEIIAPGPPQDFESTDTCEEFVPIERSDEEANNANNKATNTELIIPEEVSYSVEYQEPTPVPVREDTPIDDDKLIDYVDQDMEELELVLNIEGQQDETNYKVVPEFSVSIAEDVPNKQRKGKGIDEGIPEASHVCTYCGNNYSEKAKLSLHMKIHTKEKPHQCEICFKRFSQTPQLARHMNSHTGSRPFMCRYCKSSFADPSTRIKHERIHTNVRPYECTVCQKSFSYTNVLKVHMMTHTGEKPHSCKYCGKQFSQAHHMKKHERLHENANPQPITIG